MEKDKSEIALEKTVKAVKKRKLKAIQKYADGNYGLTTKIKPSENFKNNSIVAEGLEEEFINQ